MKTVTTTTVETFDDKGILIAKTITIYSKDEWGEVKAEVPKYNPLYPPNLLVAGVKQDQYKGAIAYKEADLNVKKTY